MLDQSTLKILNKFGFIHGSKDGMVAENSFQVISKKDPLLLESLDEQINASIRAAGYFKTGKLLRLGKRVDAERFGGLVFEFYQKAFLSYLHKKGKGELVAKEEDPYLKKVQREDGEFYEIAFPKIIVKDDSFFTDCSYSLPKKDMPDIPPLGGSYQ